MATPEDQPLDVAADRFLDWLDQAVTAAGRGDGLERLDVDPGATFWLGRLASGEEVQNSPLGDRGERLDPCAIGIRLRPVGAGPWSMDVTLRMRAWLRDPQGAVADPRGPWRRSDEVTVSLPVKVQPTGQTVEGRRQLAEALTDAGADGLTAEVRVDVEDRDGVVELVVQFVNTSPEQHPVLKDTHLYETGLEVRGLDTTPFELEQLPDSFRYDRRIPAYGINVGIALTDETPQGFKTTDTVTVTTYRPAFWNSPRPMPDLKFSTLAEDCLPPMRELVAALREYDEEHWSDEALETRARDSDWNAETLAEARGAAAEVFAELSRLEGGLRLLEEDPDLRRAFELMNVAIGLSAQGRGYIDWRPFQIGFLLQTIGSLTDPDHDADVVDTVWFATGGGKTETYLGLLVTAALHDRITGKSSGLTAWSRFPLRLLSLQQTQRFADALAGAELVRRREGIRGAPISLGFLVGKGGTPNKVVPQASDDDPDPDSPGMPDRYQVLMHCPFCRGDLKMRFDRRFWRLAHECPNDDCPWPERSLPVYVVDQEVFRFLPTVVLGTLDKAASLGLQAAMRGLVGPPLGICSEPGHGYCYAPRSARPNGCLVPDCTGQRRELPMPRRRFAPTLRLQDELHLLRDSLGAVDSHYESLLDHLQQDLQGPPSKVIASSATLTGYQRQVEVLYRRRGRVFPQPGPRTGESFWSRPTPQPLRRFVAVAPRGVTLEHVTDRTVDVMQKAVRRLVTEPAVVCAEADIQPVHAAALLDLYGTDVIYGSTLYDVEAAERSLSSNSTVEGTLNSVQLTGQTDFDEVRQILDELEKPQDDFFDRIHVVAASSMLSHGVDVSRLNTMVMLGLPLGTAEFIQTSARVGRRYPGLVHVLHKIGRERDAQVFRQFGAFVTQGDRFIEPIPITRRSRRVLRLTLPGIVEARRLALQEPRAVNQRLTTVRALRDFVRDNGLSAASETQVIAAALGFEGPVDELLRDEIRIWLGGYFTNMQDPALASKLSPDVLPDRPMISLRDVEASAPIHD
ncbi:helicase-related protein [Geodermatophilus sp. SYSU D01062]